MGKKKTRNPEYRILATGDRNWASPDVTDKVMNDYVARYPGHRMKVIEGGAKGADAAAADWAARNKVKHVQVKADWAKHHRAAGPIRNKRMLEEHDPDAVVGFHDDISRSKGTANMLDLAMKDWPKRQRTIELYNSKGEVRQMARNEPSKRRVKKSLADLGEISKALKTVDESPEFSSKWEEAERRQRIKGRKRIATSTALGAGIGGLGGAAINQKGMRGKGAAWSAGGSAVLSGSMAALNNRQRRKARENLRGRIRLAPSGQASLAPSE